MGGIAGIVHFRGDAPDRDQAHQLSAGVAHRGPDDKGTFGEGPAILAARRFRGNAGEPRQPASNERFVLVLDGRMYGSDVAEILADWTTRGPRCLPDLLGSFAMAVWDRREHVLWLARGSSGACPLFWARDRGHTAFASEIGPLLHLPWVSRSFATDHVAEYLSFRYVHAPRTLFRALSSVPPGHLVRIDGSGEQLVRWWTPSWAPPGTPAPDDRDVVERVDGAVRVSVSRRLVGGDVGVLLSGGLDSSAILYHAQQLALSPLHSFTVALSEDPLDETSFARRVSTMLGVEHHIVRLDGHQIVDAIDLCTRLMGQPLPTAAAVLQHLLYKEISTTCRTVLSGDGGDEVLGGRGLERVASRLRRAWVLAQAPGPLKGALRLMARRGGVGDLAASHAHFGRDRNIGGSRVFHSAARVKILRDPGMVRPGIRRTVLEPLYQEVDTDPINAILHVWQRGWLPEDSLARSDRMAAHAGLEVRYPMLDADLHARCNALPGEVKVSRRGLGFVTKWPLRQAMADRIPRPFLNRPKRALPSPLDGWLRDEGRDFVRDRIDAVCNDEDALFEPREARRLMTEHLEGKRNHGLMLWTLCLFQAWRQVHRG